MNPPIPLFKIPPTQWSAVLQRVAQGESLRQIARSYHTSHEAVHRVLNAARKDLVASQGEAVLPPTPEARGYPHRQVMNQNTRLTNNVHLSRLRVG